MSAPKTRRTCSKIASCRVAFADSSVRLKTGQQMSQPVRSASVTRGIRGPMADLARHAQQARSSQPMVRNRALIALQEKYRQAERATVKTAVQILSLRQIDLRACRALQTPSRPCRAPMPPAVSATKGSLDPMVRRVRHAREACTRSRSVPHPARRARAAHIPTASAPGRAHHALQILRHRQAVQLWGVVFAHLDMKGTTRTCVRNVRRQSTRPLSLTLLVCHARNTHPRRQERHP